MIPGGVYLFIIVFVIGFVELNIVKAFAAKKLKLKPGENIVPTSKLVILTKKDSGNYYIPVKLNDRSNPISMLYDTGSYGILLDPGVAKWLGLDKQKSLGTESVAIGGSRGTGTLYSVRVGIGNSRKVTTTATVVDLTHSIIGDDVVSQLGSITVGSGGAYFQLY